MGLRLKFNLILLGCFILGLVAASIIFYQVARASAMQQLHAQIGVLRAQALAVRTYTSDEIRPLLNDQSNLQFLPQTVPSFSAQSVFTKFRDSYSEFYYKEAALNPTNPSDLAQPWERTLIEKLRADPAITEVVEIRNSPKGPQYLVAYPLTIKSESCLSCHSTPDKAPASMTALYGKQNGFGWKLNETIGAQIISVPFSVVDKQIWSGLWLMIGSVCGIFAVLLLIINYLLSRMVISPIMAVADVAERVSMGDNSLPEYTRPGSDEISKLLQSFNRMRRSLDSAMKLLDT